METFICSSHVTDPIHFSFPYTFHVDISSFACLYIILYNMRAILKTQNNAKTTQKQRRYVSSIVRSIVALHSLVQNKSKYGRDGEKKTVKKVVVEEKEKGPELDKFGRVVKKEDKDEA